MTDTVTVAQRRARLIARHHLASPAESVIAAADAMIALHATDPLTVYLSAWARTACAPGEVDEAVYEKRLGVRILGMRRTMWVVHAPLLPVVQAACTDDVAARLRRQLVRDLERLAGVTGADEWLRDVDGSVLRALSARGSAGAAELSQDEPRLSTQLTPRSDKSYDRPQAITSRVLMLLSAEGRIVRGHRRGGWSSGQFTYYPTAAWLGAEPERLDASAARAELARRWLLTFGPAPASDLRWWAGWTGAQTRAALSALDTREVDLDGRAGVLLASDPVADTGPKPVAALLPGLDPTPMGWQDRSWFLGPHAPPLFDRTGNIGPTVWWEGRVIGGWAQRASGEIVCRLLEDAGSDAVTAVDAVARRLETWLGERRVTPRYRNPLERELSA
jgi:hypothetical protein